MKRVRFFYARIREALKGSPWPSASKIDITMPIESSVKIFEGLKFRKNV